MKKQIQQQFGPLEEGQLRAMSTPAAPSASKERWARWGSCSSVTEPFCQGLRAGCASAADGKLRLCLLRDDEVDLLNAAAGRGLLGNAAQPHARRGLTTNRGHGLAEGRFAENRAMNQIGG
jgi:cyclic pyranopterin phosphate synthase